VPGSRRIWTSCLRGSVEPGAQGRGRVQGAGGEAVVAGRGLGGGDVDDDGSREGVAADEVLDVGGEGGDQLVLVAAVAWLRSAGADLPVGGGEFAPHGAGEPVRQYAARGEVLRRSESDQLVHARDAVAEALGKHARPARLILVDEIATLASGKPDREAIRRIAAELR